MRFVKEVSFHKWYRTTDTAISPRKNKKRIVVRRLYRSVKENIMRITDLVLVFINKERIICNKWHSVELFYIFLFFIFIK